MNALLKKIFFGIFIFINIAVPQSNYAQKNNVVTDNFKLIVHYKDTLNATLPIAFQINFESLQSIYTYINNLPAMLQSKGYVVASVDSIWQLTTEVNIMLYIGTKYNWVQLNTNGIEKDLLSKIGYNEKNFFKKPLNIEEVNVLKEKLLKHYENEGYPFAKVFLDSVQIINDSILASLTVYKIALYKIDSIKNYGKLNMNNKFLQSYLNITNGSAYSFEKLQDVDRKIRELPYADMISPSSLSMLGTGATLNLNINSKKSSEASAIVGFLPDANNTGKLQITGDVNFDLKNVFGGGEGIIFKYQALQPKSPRINLGFDKPYIFHTQFGTGFLFELFKKDSSYLQRNAQLNLQLNLSKYQSGKIIFQFQNTSLLGGGIDTNQIKSQKRLPNIIDVSGTNIGLQYELNKTNYRFNPLRGNELLVIALVGIKTIEKNSDVLSLVSPTFNYASLYDSLQPKSYQLRLKILANHYTPLSKSSTIKTALQLGIYQSPNIFRNEVFQIGGYKLLRGFDEESIYATQYAVFTAEYRSLLSLNSYFFGFSDAAVTNTNFQNINSHNFFISGGLGILYQTKAGLLNISFAVGKRDDVPFNIRQAVKVHFGYINYF